MASAALPAMLFRDDRLPQETLLAGVGAAVVFNLPVELGLAPKDMALLPLTFVVRAITLGSGRTNLMQGAVHLVLFAAFLFLTLVP